MNSTTIHQRRSSRSNSTSSSVVTVKKAASLSSRSRSQRPHLRATSPDPFGSQLASVASSTSGRTSGSRSRPSSALENKSSSNLNINRWSHSTTSSLSGIENESSWNRRTSPSNRTSVVPAQALSTTITSVRPHLTAKVEDRSTSRQAVKKSPQKRDDPRLGLPPNPPRPNHIAQTYYGKKVTTPSIETAPSMASEILDSSAPRTAESDYFGETWTGQPKVNGLDPAKTIYYAITSSPGTGIPRSRTGKRSAATSPQEQRSPEASRKTGHARHRERSVKGSTDTAAGSSMSSTNSERSRAKGHRSPTQKTMLGKALTKANTAVLLDNAQDFERAVLAYAEACDLLTQVMMRNSDNDDQTKLSTIKATYSNRIVELRQLEEPFNNLLNKALPEAPSDADDDPHDAYYEDELPIMSSDHSRTVNGVAIPPRLESMLPSAVSDDDFSEPRTYVNDRRPPPALSAHPPAIQTGLFVPMQSEYMPPPLSPRRPPSPPPVTLAETKYEQEQLEPAKVQHAREASSESTSWLDTIDESGSSSSSRLSSLDFRPSVSQNLVDEIEAEFDAAMNAAVDAAYDEDRTPVAGIERPVEAADIAPTSNSDSRQQPTSNVVELPAESHVNEHSDATQLLTPVDDDDDEADEEERLLEEMTLGYVLGDFHFDPQSKSALPRQSDSSSFSGRTLGSSVASTTMTSGTTLSTLAEGTEFPSKPLFPSALPQPTTALPLPPLTEQPIPPIPLMPPPPTPVSRQPSLEKFSAPGVRDRRLSGQNAKQLKIETFAKSPVSSQQQLAPLPKIQVPPQTEQRSIPSLTGPVSTNILITTPLTPMTSIHSADSLTSESPATSLPAHNSSQGSIDETGTIPASPGRFLNKMRPPTTGLRKNVSSNSLGMRNLSVTTTENESPLTPGSATFPADSRKAFSGMPPPIPTPTGGNFDIGPQFGGLYLFDDNVGSPSPPRTPRTPSLMQTTPWPLESCPEAFLLRPFWLMRTLYQTIAHPRGGYLTTKLFLPRDIWRVKNVKLKAIDEKISQCDLLTAALLKLTSVDQYDADAVLEELQAFESVMDQVRSFLHKKLGGDVGFSGSSAIFKGSPSTEGPPDGALDMKSGNASNSAKNSFASSWRKLRSKSSGAGIHTNYSSISQRDPGASALTMPTLPMTSSTNPTPSRYAPRRIAPSLINLSGMGPNANYMGSLARLFDAAQVLDAIARQVEDPGLKCSNQTQVGLELSVRNASEFFGFYVLRFVVGDVGVLVDKFVKRGSEWVLA